MTTTDRQSLHRLDTWMAIREVAPEKCYGCLRPDSIAKSLSEDVMNPRSPVSLESARQALIDTLAEHCIDGAIRSNTATSCGGVSCSFKAVE